jgi:hypothetical protein
MKYEILGKATFRVNFEIEADSEIDAEEKAILAIKAILPTDYLHSISSSNITAIELESHDVIV